LVLEKDLGISFWDGRFSKIISRKGILSMWFFGGEEGNPKGI